MKIFYSELTANPGYYSFGYSIYAQLEPGDSVADAYDKGFLPFVGARKQEQNMMYMVRGCRISPQAFKEHHYHGRVLRKIESFAPQGIEVIQHKKEEFEVTDAFVEFVLGYFNFRFGKEAMPKERLLALLASPFMTHIVEFRLQGKPIAYTLEAHTEKSMHVWYITYARTYENTHLGAYLFINLLRRAKAQQKEWVYFGGTYGSWMKYKTNFQPLEYWDGATWVIDPKSRELKKLLVSDSLRALAFTDQWREAREPYYVAPYPFHSTFQELRFLMLTLTATPRVFLGFALVVFITMVSIYVRYFFN